MSNTRHVGSGISARSKARAIQSLPILTAIVLATIATIVAQRVHAQTTLTWATPGVSQNIGDAGNWVGGVAPNFAGDATTDSAVFSAGTNTTVKLRNVAPTTTSNGDVFKTVSFDGSAPVYSFGLPTGNSTNELQILAGGDITNSSANTQNLTSIAAVTLNAATGAAGKLVATGGDAGTKLSFDLSQIKFNNAGSATNANTSVVDLSTGFDVRTVSINGIKNAGVTSFLNVNGNADGTGGRLFITGSSGTNTGIINITTGAKVRISNGNALGDPTTTLPAVAAGDSYTRLNGGGSDNGRLELVGDITVPEGFRLGARQNSIDEYNNIHSPQILNVSGTNTLTGNFAFTTGGSNYTFGSDAGTLVIQSNLLVTTSGVRYLTFLGAGNILVSGNIQDTNTGVDPSKGIAKYDSGTTTFNGSNNTGLGPLSIRGGTLALGATAAITFAPVCTDIDMFDPRNQAPLGPEGQQPRVTLAAGTTFDVSAKTGGFTLTQTLEGKGTIKGTINMASGTRIRPGAFNFYDGQGNNVVGSEDGIGTLTFQGGSASDYNGNGTVDAADYVLWRKNPGAFGGTPAGYDSWRSSFGNAGGSGGLNLAAGGIFQWQLGALSTSNPGTDFDQIVLTNSNIALGGTSNVALDFTITGDPNSGDPFWTSTHSWKIIDTTTNTGNTNFASITNGTFTLGHFTTTVGSGANAGDILLNYVLGAGSGLGSGSIPEPGSLMFVALGSLGVLFIRKR